MIVCVCKKVSDSQIKREICRGACSVNDLGERLGLGTQCGCCRETAQEIIEEHHAPMHFQPMQSFATA